MKRNRLKLDGKAGGDSRKSSIGYNFLHGFKLKPVLLTLALNFEFIWGMSVKFVNIVRMLIFVAGFVFLTAATVQAQPEATGEASAGIDIDGYRAMAITAGIVGGALVAAIVTDGLVIPVYVWATGGEAAGAGMMSGVGLPTVEGVVQSTGNWLVRFGRDTGYQMGDAIRIFGAATGGLLADDWYTRE
jgi:hypothetical protein